MLRQSRARDRSARSSSHFFRSKRERSFLRRNKEEASPSLHAVLRLRARLCRSTERARRSSKGAKRKMHTFCTFSCAPSLLLRFFALRKRSEDRKLLRGAKMHSFCSCASLLRGAKMHSFCARGASKSRRKSKSRRSEQK